MAVQKWYDKLGLVPGEEYAIDSWGGKLRSNSHGHRAIFVGLTESPQRQSRFSQRQVFTGPVRPVFAIEGDTRRHCEVQNCLGGKLYPTRGESPYPNYDAEPTGDCVCDGGSYDIPTNERGWKLVQIKTTEGIVIDYPSGKALTWAKHTAAKTEAAELAALQAREAAANNERNRQRMLSAAKALGLKGNVTLKTSAYDGGCSLTITLDELEAMVADKEANRLMVNTLVKNLP